jgi:hypothetical protein
MEEGKLTIEELDEFDRLAKAESQDLIEFCASVYMNPTWNKIIRRLKMIQQEATFEEATTERELLNGRAVVEGIELINAFFKKYSNKLKQGG